MSRRNTDAAEALMKIQAMLDSARAGGQGGFGFDIDEASRILSAASLKQEPESKHPGRTPDSVATELLSDDDVESIPKLERVDQVRVHNPEKTQVSLTEGEVPGPR